MPLATGKMAIIYTPYRCDGLRLGAILALQWFEPERRPRLIHAPEHSPFESAASSRHHQRRSCHLSSRGEPAHRGSKNRHRELPGLSPPTQDHQARRAESRPHLAWSRVSVYFGRISYSFYLYHTIVLFLVAKHFGQIDASRLGQANCLVRSCPRCDHRDEHCVPLRHRASIQSLRRFVLK
jgi:hypothetical protein